jgi:uncharacterized membrane protein
VTPDSLEEITNLDDSRLYAAMAYLMVLVFVPWLTRRDDPFVNWHVRQGLVVFMGMILALVAAVWSAVLGNLLFLLLLVGDLVALVMALQGRRWKIPGIGTLASKIKI